MSSADDLAAQLEGVVISESKKDEAPSPTIMEMRQHFLSKTLRQSTFSLKATLGTGTFGRVRLATYRYKEKKQYYALKMMKKYHIVDKQQVAHIKSEMHILSRISHPFIVNLFAAFQDVERVYMLLEYVIGGELFSMLRAMTRFNNDTSRFYAAEITLAFEYLHKKKIVYRDLKPENLLVDEQGHIKITDFGFAKTVHDRTYTTCGTPEYLAPEIILSKGHTKAVDWWGLGILIYECLAGCPPFFDDDPRQIYQMIVDGHFTCPRDFKSSAKDLIEHLLEADVSKRYGNLKDGADDIKNHAWFRGIDWDDVYHRRLKPPYCPPVRSPDDTSNFDEYPDSPRGARLPVLSAKHQAHFANFTMDLEVEI